MMGWGMTYSVIEHAQNSEMPFLDADCHSGLFSFLHPFVPLFLRAVISRDLSAKLTTPTVQNWEVVSFFPLEILKTWL